MKTALLFGSSGLIGGHLLRQLIENNDYTKIKVFVRSVPEINDPKVEIIKTDFNNLDNHKEEIKGDDCFFCIGTTKKNSPDKNEYRRVELDVPKKIAQIAKSNSVNFKTLGIMRPSFLLGERKEKRVGEKIGIFIFKLFSPLFIGPLKKMKPIHSEKVASAMIMAAKDNLDQTIFESNDIVEISN